MLSPNAFKTARQSILKNTDVSMVVDDPRPVVHGGTGKKKREKTGKSLLDFSASLNPHLPEVMWECPAENLASYPDNDYTLLKECIAKTFRRDTDEICVGNGSIELIRVFCAVTLSKGSKYHTEMPTFGEYALSARLAGASATPSVSGAAVSFICNPNNPTGILRTRAEMIACLEEVSSSRNLLFVDEAFIDLADPGASLCAERDPSLFVLGSLTKSFAVPGLRFGYGFGDPDLIARIETVRPPWSVNAYAEAFALAAFPHLGELEASRAYIEKERKYLEQEFKEIGLWYHPSAANYLLADCARPARELAELLEIRHGILVRDCTSFGLPTSIRVAVRTHDENKLLVEALSACMP
jgi:threonine-phosphate decarboxylase